MCASRRSRTRRASRRPAIRSSTRCCRSTSRTAFPQRTAWRSASAHAPRAGASSRSAPRSSGRSSTPPRAMASSARGDGLATQRIGPSTHAPHRRRDPLRHARARHEPLRAAARVCRRRDARPDRRGAERARLPHPRVRRFGVSRARDVPIRAIHSVRGVNQSAPITFFVNHNSHRVSETAGLDQPHLTGTPVAAQSPSRRCTDAG